MFLCEFDHHRRQLVQNKDSWQALVSYQPVSNLFMPGDRKLVCFYHLEKETRSETDRFTLREYLGTAADRTVSKNSS